MRFHYDIMFDITVTTSTNRATQTPINNYLHRFLWYAQRYFHCLASADTLYPTSLSLKCSNKIHVTLHFQFYFFPHSILWSMVAGCFRGLFRFLWTVAREATASGNHISPFLAAYACTVRVSPEPNIRERSGTLIHRRLYVSFG